VDVLTLAQALVAADPPARPALLADHAALAGLALAEALREIYFASYSSTPAQAAAATAALTVLAESASDQAIDALAHWIAGLAALQLEGRLDEAITQIDRAATLFTALGRSHTAAETQVGKVVALARLGRYAEALTCGQAARTALLAHNDAPAAGRIELNLGNLCFQRDQYAEAEAYYRSAHARFAAAADQRMLAFVANGLANVYSRQLRITEAAAAYETALAAAIASGQQVTQAEIECNLGSLALFQGRYEHALSLLEGSRKRYAALDLPHESAVAELELGDAYLELGLLEEATQIYRRVCDVFAAMGMPAEQARALLNYSRACLQLGQADAAWVLLEEAAAGFRAEGNQVGLALATLATAWIAYRNGDYAAVAALAAAAEAPLLDAAAWEPLLSVRWLRGVAAGASGDPSGARALLEATLAEAESHGARPVAQRCATALGQLAEAAGDHAAAEAAFRQAITIGETLRAPLPADALRIALANETLAPYNALMRICLAAPGEQRTVEAFHYAERGRARALVELLSSAVRLPTVAVSGVDAADLAQLSNLRAELNWLYTRLNRLPLSADAGAGAPAMLAAAVREREATLSALQLRLQLSDGSSGHAPPLDLDALRLALGSATALVEYVDLDGQLVAFVLTDAGLLVVRSLGSLEAVSRELQRLHFQMGALSYGAAAPRNHLATLTTRTRRHLQRLAELLLQPIEPLIGARRLVVVPCGPLHYVPFHALADAHGYLIERREVCVAPSAAALLQCLERPRAALHQALLVGVADAQTPHAEAEVTALAAALPAATTLIGPAATQAALRAAAPKADVIHLACHAHFRADNPLFSALQLADGRLTVHDAWSLNLQCQLVTLSACETGMHTVAPGDELLGLARGFFAAGAPALLVSMWRVDDAATALFMQAFYQGLVAGERPAAALRSAQCAILARDPHPFFWAPFMLLGRW
jgi:tetratricopeptide (TPR) repeat protein